MRPGFFLSAVIVLFLCAPVVSHAADPLIIGVGTHTPPDRALDMIAAAGIPSIRDDIRWDNVEREKGVLAMPERYDRYVAAVRSHGLKPLLVLCYGNKFYDDSDFPRSAEALEAYARFAEFVVKHFQGQVQMYEVWNEWNDGTGLPTSHHGKAGDYVALLAKTYPRLKAIEPGITVLGGAISGNGVATGWFKSACDSGLLNHLDALSYHPYCWRATGSARTPDDGLLKLVEENRAIAQHYRRDVPVYLTEIGWPNQQGANSTSLNDTAAHLVRSYVLLRKLPYIKGVWWYDFRDDGTDKADPEQNFGLVTNDFMPKPAYFALKRVCRYFLNEQ